MSDFEDDYDFGGAFEAGPGEDSSTGDGSSTGEDAPVVKHVRFGAIELGLFVSLWVLLGTVYWYMSRRQRAAKRARALSERRRWLGDDIDALPQFLHYQELLAADCQDTQELKRALMHRTIADVRRLLRLQEDRGTLMALSKAGAFGEDMLAALKEADREIELEILEVQAEAETFREGWGASILSEAAHIMRLEDEYKEMARRQERKERMRAPDAAPPSDQAEQASAPAQKSPPAAKADATAATKTNAAAKPKTETAPKASSVATPDARKEITEEEKQRLLEELLSDSETASTSASSSKARKRFVKT